MVFSFPTLISDSIQIACLPTAEIRSAFIGQNCYTAGWGALESGAYGPVTAHSVNVEIFDDETCANMPFSHPSSFFVPGMILQERIQGSFVNDIT